METLDTLYDSIIDDMNREDFTVGDKYKPKYEELGKQSTSLYYSSLFFSLLLFPQ